MPSWSERELEDWLCSAPPGADDWRIFDFMRQRYSEEEIPTTVTRQLDLGVGTADIVMYDAEKMAVWILELKAAKATGRALTQVLNYSAIVRAWLTRHQCPTEGVRSFILAPDFTERLLRTLTHIAFANCLCVQASFTCVRSDLHTPYQEEYKNIDNIVPSAVIEDVFAPINRKNLEETADAMAGE